MRCSTSKTRAASVSTVSPATTGTASCMIIGPESTSGATKCTVAPCIFTPAEPALDQPRRKQPHEPGKAYKLDPVCLEHGLQRVFERLAILAVVFVIDHRRGNALRLRARQSGGVGPVGNHQRNFGRVVDRLRGLDERRHIRPTAGNEDGDAF